VILVSGATGTVGREVVAQLLAAGHEVRALTRDPAKAKFDAKVEIVVGDLTQPSTLARAVGGARRVFSLATGPDLAIQETNLAAAAKHAGVEHVVKLSVLEVGGDPPNAISEWHKAGERAYEDSGIAWTFVRPGSFMSNALTWVGAIKAQGKVFSSYGEGKFPPVHPRDIAAVAVAALTSPGHEGKAYRLTGPEALTMAEQVQILSKATGRSIELVSLSIDAARGGMVKAGMPPMLVEALLDVAAWVRSGRAAEILPTVAQITGRAPLTFGDWAREHAEAFR
jgi:uncharacterized protein YbjT (DUF2867 family)